MQHQNKRTWHGKISSMSSAKGWETTQQVNCAQHNAWYKLGDKQQTNNQMRLRYSQTTFPAWPSTNQPTNAHVHIRLSRTEARQQPDNQPNAHVRIRISRPKDETTTQAWPTTKQPTKRTRPHIFRGLRWHNDTSMANNQTNQDKQSNAHVHMRLSQPQDDTKTQACQQPTNQPTNKTTNKCPRSHTTFPGDTKTQARPTTKNNN